jgi:hypothetical protein
MCNPTFCHTVISCWLMMEEARRYSYYQIIIPLFLITKYIDLGGWSNLRHVLLGPLLVATRPSMTGCHCIHALLHGYFGQSFSYFRALLSSYEWCYLVMLYCTRDVHKGLTLVVVACEQVYLAVQNGAYYRAGLVEHSPNMVVGDGVGYFLNGTIASVSCALWWTMEGDYHQIWWMLKRSFSFRNAIGTSPLHDKANMTLLVAMTTGGFLIHSPTTMYFLFLEQKLRVYRICQITDICMWYTWS